MLLTAMLTAHHMKVTTLGSFCASSRLWCQGARKQQCRIPTERGGQITASFVRLTDHFAASN